MLVETGARYQFRLLSEQGDRTLSVLFEQGGRLSFEVMVEGSDESVLDVGRITIHGATAKSRSSDDSGEDDSHCRPARLDDCSFSTYNLDVQVGDKFILENFIEDCPGELGVDMVFGYEDGESWNLSAVNDNSAIEIVESDLNGGNHGEGEYRLFLLDASTGDVLDHITVRVGHDDESDIQAGDDQLTRTPSSTHGSSCDESVPEQESETEHGTEVETEHGNEPTEPTEPQPESESESESEPDSL
jgi:hypothetical protein